MSKSIFKVLSVIFTGILIVIIFAVGLSIINDIGSEKYTLTFNDGNYVLEVVTINAEESISQEKLNNIESNVKVGNDEYIVWSTNKNEIDEVDVFKLREDTDLYAYVLPMEYKVNVSGNRDFDYELIYDGKLVSGSIVELKLNNLGSLIPIVKIGDIVVGTNEAGNYEIFIIDEDVEVYVTFIEKLEITPLLDETYIYDGNAKEVYYLLYDSNNNVITDVEIKYYDSNDNEVSEIINAGTYKVVYHYTGSTYIVEDETVELIVEKATYDMSGVEFNDATYTYDGNEKELVISGTLPVGLEVSYSTNKLTNAGTLEVVATFTGNSNYHEVESMSATLTINKATYDMSGVSFNDKIYDYDGNEKELVISGTLPVGLEVSYSTNKLTNAGTIEVVATFTGNSNYYEVESMSAKLVINKVALLVTGRSYQVFVGEGIEDLEFEVAITGFVNGEDESVLKGSWRFFCNVTKDSPAGIYPIAFEGMTSENYGFNYVFGNVEVVQDSYIITTEQSDLTKVYNGTNQTFEANLRSKEGYIDGIEFSYVLDGNEFTGAVDAGQYTVLVSYDDPTYGTGSIEVIFTITKATYDMNSVVFENKEYTYDGTEKSLVVSGNLPTGVEVNYTLNTLTNVGMLEVVATFIGDNKNYNPIPTMKATLSITEKPLELSMFDDIPKQRYTGSEIKPVVSGVFNQMNLVLGTDYTVTYINNINVGTATITINGINNFSGEVKLEFTIEFDDLAKAIKDLEEILNKYDGTLVDKVFKDSTYNSIITYIPQSTQVSIDDEGNVSVVEISSEQVVVVYVIATQNNAVAYGEIEFVIPAKVSAEFVTDMTIGDLAALTTPSNIVVEVSGVITNIANTQYGNFYLTDPVTKDQILVYGLIKHNEEKFSWTDNGEGRYVGTNLTNDKSFSSLGLNEGDYITIRAIVAIYGGKSQLQGEYVEPTNVVQLEYGIDVTIDNQLGSVSGINGKYNFGDTVSFTVTPKVGYVVSSVKVNHGFTGTSYDSEVKTLTSTNGTYTFNASVINNLVIEFREEEAKAPEFETDKTIGDLIALDSERLIGVEISGVVTKIIDTNYGNLYLTDPETKEQIYVYGLMNTGSSKFGWTDDGTGKYVANYTGNDKTFSSVGISEGDYITVHAFVSIYNSNVQLIAEYISTGTTPVSGYEVEISINTNEGSISEINSSYQYGDEVSFTITPKAGYAVKSVTINQGCSGANYSNNSTILIPSNGTYKFNVNVINELTIEFKEESTSNDNPWEQALDLSKLVDGTEIIITNIAGDKAMDTQNTKFRNIIDFNGDNVSDSIVTFILIKNDDGSYLIKGTDGYLYYKGSSNELYTSNDLNSIGVTTASWNISVVNPGEFTLVNVAVPERYIQFNSGNTRFACYKNTMPNVGIYVKVETIETEPTDSEKVTLDKETLNIETNITNSITLPSVGTYSTITWTSSNTNVISISNGVVTVNRQSSDTTVTLTATLKLNDVEETKEFEVVVLKKEVVTPTSLFNDGDKVLIAAIRSNGNYFIANNDLGTASTKRYQAIDSGVNDATLLAITSDNQVWTVRFDGTNYYLEDVNGLKMDWSSGNSGKLTTNGSPLTITKNDDGTYTVALTGNADGRLLSLNSDSGNNYFAFYKPGQKSALQIIKLSSAETTLTDEEKANLDKEDLSIETNIIDSINLPNSGNYSTISWSSNDSNIISINGSTVTVNQQSEVKTVTLTALITVGSVNVSKVFEVTVSALLTDQEKLNYDIENLSIPSSVTKELNLPSSGTYSTITWTTEDTEVITIIDNVATFVQTNEGKNVTLYAIFKVNELESDPVEIDIYVEAHQTEEWLQINSVSELTDGSTIIITASDNSKALGSQNSTYRNAIDFDQANVSSTITQITIEKLNDAYLLKTTEGYIYSSGDKKVDVTTSSDNATAQWNISYEDGVFIIANVANTSSILQYNTSSPRFTTYSSVQGKLNIYKLEVGNKTPEEIVERDMEVFSLPNTVKSGYVLDYSSKYGSSISWSTDSSGSAYLNTNQLVNNTSSSVYITLTAKFSYEGISQTKEYSVTILPKSTVEEIPDLDDYYSSITANSGSQLKSELRTLITETHHTKTSYDDCKDPSIVEKTDGDPDNPGNIILFWSGLSIDSAWENGNTWNREHVWPQSQGWFKTSGAGSDLHHIRPTDQSVNSSHGNNPYGYVTGGKYVKTSKYNGTITTECLIGGGYFEPVDSKKGDCARIIFYLLTRYSESDSYSITNVSYSMEMLLEWNELDPVDDSELRRNNAVEEIQGNRNPFIDYANFADLIWG